jgi:hypothetical protein
LTSLAPVAVSAVFFLTAAAGIAVLHTRGLAAQSAKSQPTPSHAGGPRSFEIVPLEKVSETSSNASIGDLNGDGHPDIVLVKGRHWQVTTVTFFGDGAGHFTPGPPLPSKAVKSYSGSLADMTKSGHLDIVLSNDSPDPKLILVNDGKGNFSVGGTYGDPRWPTRNAAVGDLNGYRGREPHDHELLLPERRQASLRLPSASELAQRRLGSDRGSSRFRRE